MKVSKEIIEVAEEIKNHRIDKKAIEESIIKIETLENHIKDLENNIKILKTNTINQNRLLGQIQDLEKDKKTLKLELDRYKKSFTFIVTSSQDNISNSVYGEISREISIAKDEILICSPWITLILEELHDFKRNEQEKEVTIKIITRLMKEDIEKGLMDLNKFRTLRDTLGAEIRFNNDVHAKMVIIDHSVAIISSANLTKQGFYRNYEAGISIKEESIAKKVTQFFEDIWKSAEPLTEQAIKDVVKQGTK